MMEQYVVYMNDKRSNGTYTKEMAENIEEYLKKTFPHIEVKKEKINEHQQDN